MKPSRNGLVTFTDSGAGGYIPVTCAVSYDNNDGCLPNLQCSADASSNEIVDTGFNNVVWLVNPTHSDYSGIRPITPINFIVQS